MNDFFLNLVELFNTRGVGVIMTLFGRLGRTLSTEGWDVRRAREVEELLIAESLE